MGSAVLERNGTVAATRNRFDIDALKSKTMGIKTRNIEAYRQLVRDMVNAPNDATAAKLTTDYIQSICTNAGKSIDALEADMATAHKRLDAVEALREADELQPALELASVAFADSVKVYEDEKAEAARRLENLRLLSNEAQSKKNDLYSKQRRLRADGEATMRATFNPATKLAIAEKAELLATTRETHEHAAATFRFHELYRQSKTDAERSEVVAVAREKLNVNIKPEFYERSKAGFERSGAEVARLEKEIAELQGLEGDPFAGMAWAD